MSQKISAYQKYTSSQELLHEYGYRQILGIGIQNVDGSRLVLGIVPGLSFFFESTLLRFDALEVHVLCLVLSLNVEIRVLRIKLSCKIKWDLSSQYLSGTVLYLQKPRVLHFTRVCNHAVAGHPSLGQLIFRARFKWSSLY